MNKSFRYTLVAVAVLGAYILSACGGVLPQSSPSEVAQKVQAKEIVFTGVVEQINGSEWVVSGQKFTVDPAAAMDSGIAVGDVVKVEGTVSVDGSIVALTIETSIAGDGNANDGNANDGTSNGNANSNDDNGNDDNGNDDNDNSDDNSNTAGGDADEIFGVVEAITTDSITVGGVTYQLADFTEFKDAIAVGDQVKIHVVVNADGTFTIREIERSDGGTDDDNSNTGNGNDDNGNDDNSNDDNGNDDNSNDGGGNGNDDNSGSGGGDDDNDDNGNDD